MIESMQLGLPLEQADEVVLVRPGGDHLRELIADGAPVVGPSVIVVDNYRIYHENEGIDSLLQALGTGALTGYMAGSPGLIYPCRGGTLFQGVVDLPGEWEPIWSGHWHFRVLCRRGCPTAQRIEAAMQAAMWRNAAGIVRDMEVANGIGLLEIDMEGPIDVVAERLAKRWTEHYKIIGADWPCQRRRPDFWIEVIDHYRHFQAMAQEAKRW